MSTNLVEWILLAALGVSAVLTGALVIRDYLEDCRDRQEGGPE